LGGSGVGGQSREYSGAPRGPHTFPVGVNSRDDLSIGCVAGPGHSLWSARVVQILCAERFASCLLLDETKLFLLAGARLLEPVDNR
jgi:hypothetical protein